MGSRIFAIPITIGAVVAALPFAVLAFISPHWGPSALAALGVWVLVGATCGLLVGTVRDHRRYMRECAADSAEAQRQHEARMADLKRRN